MSSQELMSSQECPTHVAMLVQGFKRFKGSTLNS
jgi:hypothetical protein